MMIELVLITSLVTFLLYAYNKFRAYYYIRLPEIYTKNTRLCCDIRDQCKTIKTPYIPTFWAANSHIQTWLKTFVRFRNQPKLTFTREYLEMNDAGIISFDWVTNDDSTKPTRKISKPTCKSSKPTRRRSIKVKMRHQENPILLIIPSAFNTRVEDYAYLCLKAIEGGFIPLFFNRRGYSRTPLTTPKVTTYCDKSDLEETLDFLNNQYPFSEIYAIAYSMESGNLISYLGHEREFSHISGAVCISSTFGCENFLNDHALKQPYNKIITEKIKTIFQREEMLEQVSTTEEVDKCHNLVELQSQIHARSNRYQTLKQYLEYNNPLSHLNRISVPIMFIHAKDDPVIPDKSIPFQFFNISESCMLVTTEYGGHCGFFQGSTPKSWSDNLSVEFLKLISKKRKVIARRNDNFNGFSNGSARNRSMTVV